MAEIIGKIFGTDGRIETLAQNFIRKIYRIEATRATRRRSEHKIEGNNEGGCVATWSAFNVRTRASRNVCLSLINFGLITDTECPNQIATSYNKAN